MLKPGDVAPDFELPGADLEVTCLEEFRGKEGLVLFFYPKDETPGCVIEATEFSDRVDAFKQLGFVLCGVSRDNCISHGNFRDRHGLDVRLLADVEGVTCEAYDVWREKEAHGVVRACLLRSTFVIDRAGVVRHALYDVKPKGHAAAVLELVRGLEGSLIVE